MRISDWSSDVCSSDLYRSGNRSDDVQGLYNIISRMYQIGFKLPAANRGSGFAPRHHIALPLMVADQGLHPIDGAQRLLRQHRSEEHTSELQSLMRISYAVFCLKKKKKHNQ